ncbi:hypothetical protein [Enterococcus sp. AZ103]|uniref:hypothetical protein n=1 Tax=Enterococcus sp. AZ103 TaxID=2774628 RepID=UPI003F251C31
MRKNQAGIEFICQFAHRLTVTKQNDLGQSKLVHYFVKGYVVQEVVYYHVGKTRKEMIVDECQLSEIYRLIKNVYDKEGVLLARRDSLKAPLRMTSKGFVKQKTG